MRLIKYFTKKINTQINKYGTRLYYKGKKMEVLKSENCLGELEEYYQYMPAECYIREPVREDVNDEIVLSIIVPLYNAEKYVDECVQGLINQKTTYKYEIILINDGSKDYTEYRIDSIKKRYSDKVRVLCQNNSGISGARNTGMSVAKGKYFAFIDQDDKVSDCFVQRMMDNAIKYNADIVKSAYCDVKSFGRKRVSEAILCVSSNGMKKELFDYRSYVYPGVFRRQLFDHIQFPVGFWYEDMIIRTLIYRQANVFVHIPDVLYYKSFHSNNSSLKVWNINSIKALDHLYLSLDLIVANDKLGLPRDLWLYQCIMREYTSIFAMRIRKLDENVRRLAFLRACSVLDELFCEEYYDELLPDNKEWQRIFKNREYKLWLLKCGYYYQ